MRIRLLLYCSLVAWLGACAHVDDGAKDAEPWIAELVCPSESQLHGTRGRMMWCERDGVRHGPEVTWLADGEIITLTDYEQGTPHGRYLQWVRGGKLYASGSYVRGKRSGVWTKYFLSGKKRCEGVYEDGAKAGTWKEWDDDETLIRQFTFHERDRGSNDDEACM